MKIIRNSFLPVGKRYGAINLLGVLLVKHDMTITPELLNHEAIHTAQMRELLYLPFYVAYVLEWIWRLIMCGGNTYRAYMNISFEREAYKCGGDLRYLTTRRRFAQWRN